MNEHRNTWDSITKVSYNGTVAKHLQVGGWPEESRSGVVSDSRPDIYMMAPIPMEFFSVLRLSITDITQKEPLSAMLRYKELVHLDNIVKKVNGFNTIRAELLTESDKDKRVYLRIYFSVDHGCTPVKYEHMTGGERESNRVATALEVHSLEQVAEGLWFPSSGLISSSDSKRANVYQAIGKIVVNQGLTDEHFDIEFPPGTKVRDEIKDTEYIVEAK